VNIGDRMKSYEKLLELKVFSFQDACKVFGNNHTAKNTLKNLLDKEYIEKVKHNLYVVCDVEHKSTIADQYMIGSKITEDACISYHSALEFYGVKNQIFYTVYVSTNKKFEEFEFEGFTYAQVKQKHNFGIQKIRNVVVTDKERTILDCINNSGLAGGNEELILCFELLNGIDEAKILEYLKKYNSKKLYAKAGFILEMFKERWSINEETLKECKKHIGSTRYYFDDETKRYPHKGVKEWNLIVPELFLNRGGTLYW